MDINKAVSDVVRYAESNPIIAAVATVVLLYMLIKKTKILFGLIVIALFWGAVMKLIDSLFKTAKF